MHPVTARIYARSTGGNDSPAQLLWDLRGIPRHISDADLQHAQVLASAALPLLFPGYAATDREEHLQSWLTSQDMKCVEELRWAGGWKKQSTAHTHRFGSNKLYAYHPEWDGVAFEFQKVSADAVLLSEVLLLTINCGSSFLPV